MGGLRPRRLCKPACVAVSDSATIGRLRAVTIAVGSCRFPLCALRLPHPACQVHAERVRTADLEREWDSNCGVSPFVWFRGFRG